MGANEIPKDLRIRDFFHHIDMGFLNRRLCMTALPRDVRVGYSAQIRHGSEPLVVLANDHLLVTTLLDVCAAHNVPTLLEALELGSQTQLFCSTERLEACHAVYNANRVEQGVKLRLDFGKPVRIAYHTKHIVSDTGRMTLAEGFESGYLESIVGVLHNRNDRFEIEPLVIGAPWFDHPRNGDASSELMWHGAEFGELLPEDIDQFSKLTDYTPKSADEWLSAMKTLTEAKVKELLAGLMTEPTKKDWGGETNDHFSSNVSVAGTRKTAAFLLKGPARFQEMTLDMCGQRADQIYRLAKSSADILVVQHAHLIGEAVRETLRNFAVSPGRKRKYCVIDGQATYRILKAYDLI